MKTKTLLKAMALIVFFVVSPQGCMMMHAGNKTEHHRPQAHSGTARDNSATDRQPDAHETSVKTDAAHDDENHSDESGTRMTAIAFVIGMGLMMAIMMF